MTMPIERTLAIIDTRNYLVAKLLSSATAADEKLRIKCLLRHYPDAQVLRLATDENLKFLGAVFGFDENAPFYGNRLREAVEADGKIKAV